MGTVLLGNGFYDYCLKDSLSVPYWFDEFSVDSNGNAVEDRTKKGYVGQPLSDATELTNPGTLVFQEGFDSGALPNSFIGSPGAVSITQADAHTKKATRYPPLNAARKQGMAAIRREPTAEQL